MEVLILLMIYTVPAFPECPPTVSRYLSVEGLTENIEYTAYRFSSKKSVISMRSLYFLFVVKRDSFSLPKTIPM